ncbi:hypothetical protein GDO86_016332 [Hymenochirus boettgeri]|nr:hypothetical protein GDO86_016332 [Hymenochirus boettgeri]
MEFTKSHTIAIDGKILQDPNIFKMQSNCAVDKKIKPDGLRIPCTVDKISAPHSKTVQCQDNMDRTGITFTTSKGGNTIPSAESKAVRDKTILFSHESDDMDITRSHTVIIDRKALCKADVHNQNADAMENNYTFSADGSKNAPLSKPLMEKTMLFPPDQDFMDLTHSCTVAIENNLLEQKKAATSILHNSARTTSQSSVTDKTVDEDDMELTKSQTMVINVKTPFEQHNQSHSHSKKRLGAVVGAFVNDVYKKDVGLLLANKPAGGRNLGPFHEKTMVFSSEQDTMDLTRSYTVAIESKALCKGSDLASLPVNKSVVILQDDMELTRSHTMVINGKSPLELLNQSHSVNKNNFSAVDGEEDMDITKSNSVFIDGIPSIEMSKEIAEKRRKSVSGMRFGFSHEKIVHIEGDMEITDVNFGRLTSDTNIPASEKTLVFSDQDSMDITRSHTVAIESKGLCKVTNRVSKNLESNLGISSYFSTLPANHTIAMLDDNMEFTRSHTMVISKDCPANLPIHPNIAENGHFTGCENKGMKIKEPDRVNETAPVISIEQSKPSLSRKSLPGLKQSFFNNDKILHLDGDMEMTSANVGELITGIKELERKPLNVYTDKTLVFSSEQDIMDLTTSHTVNIENKRIAQDFQKPNPQKILGCFSESASVPMCKSVTMLEDEKELTKSHIMVIDRNTLLEKDGMDIIKTVLEKDGMDITKTVLMESILEDASKNTLCSVKDKEEFAYANMGASTKKAGVSKSSQHITLSDQENMDITSYNSTNQNRKSDLPPNTLQNQTDYGYPPASKTVVFSMLEGDMELTKCHTMVIDGGNNLTNQNIHTLQALTSGMRPSEFSNRDNANIPYNVPKTVQEWEKISVGRENTKTVEPVHADSVFIGKKGLEQPFLTNDKTKNFSSYEADLELTKCHTAAIEVGALTGEKLKRQTTFTEKSFFIDGQEIADIKDGSARWQQISKLKNRNQGSLTTVCSMTPVSAPTVSSPYNTDEMDLTKSHMIAIDNKTINENKQGPNMSVLEKSVTSMNQPTSDLKHKHLENEAVIGNIVENTPNVPTQKEPSDPVLNEETMCFPETADKLAKRGKSKSKRVSFMLPKTEVESYKLDVVDAPDVTVVIPDIPSEREQEAVKSLDECSDGCVLTPNMTVAHDHNMRHYKDVVIMEGKTSNICPEGFEPTTAHCGNLVEFSEADKMRRRSIADIQSKIKNLTKISKNIVDSKTAPVSSLVEQLSPSLEATVCDQAKPVLEDKELAPKLPTAENPYQYGKADDTVSGIIEKTAPKEKCMASGHFVKIFQPMLPQKISVCKSSLQGTSVSPNSKSQMKPDRKSLTCLQALTDCSDSPCIDEEILPICPEERDQDSFHYEVPEGAWEEMFEKEAVQQNLEQEKTDNQSSVNAKKRARENEEQRESQKEKRTRNDCNNAKVLEALSSPDKYQVGEVSCHQATKTIEETICSNSSQDSRGDGIPLELSSSQQCSQMESQLPWDTGCEQSLWSKFQDGSITVKEFFMLLRIRILIQKPRYSELPVNCKANKAITAEDRLLDQCIYQPKLRVYEEECHTIYQNIEDLKTCAEMQEKPLIQINSLLWEAMRMCSEDEMIYFGVKLRNLKSSYTKKSKVLAHERKVSIYSKLLHTMQAQCQELQSRINTIDTFLEETDQCISELKMEIFGLDEQCRNENLINMDPEVKELQMEIEKLVSEKENCKRESSQQEQRREKIIAQLGCVQEEAQNLGRQLEQFNFTEWELNDWTDDQTSFSFLYDSIELNIKFEDVVGDTFIRKPCRRVSMVAFESLLNEETAPPSSLLVHRLVMQFFENNGSFPEKCKTQKDLPQLLFDLSLAVSRCRLLGEEIEYLMKWGAKYNILKTQVNGTEITFLFSSCVASAKFDLILHLSELYPTCPLKFSFRNYIGQIDYSAISTALSKVPVGLWYLKRAVRHIHRNLLM